MGLPSDGGSVLPLRSAVLTSTHCPRETLKHLAKQAGPRAPPPEVWALGSQGTPARLRAQPAQRVRAMRRARARASFSFLVASPRRARAGLSLAPGVTAVHAPRRRAPRRRPRLARAPRPCARTVRRCGRAVGASGHFRSRAAVGLRRPEPLMAGRRPAGDRRAGR